MRQIYERLFVGTERECRTGNAEWAVVHACKSPCHQGAVGYKGSLPSTHPNYLVLERDADLYLNIIDPPKPLFMRELFISFLEFSIRHWDSGANILIHCNQGESRAPSLAMLFLAKHIQIIPNDSFDSALQEFRNMDPCYQPGAGIRTYLRDNWGNF